MSKNFAIPEEKLKPMRRLIELFNSSFHELSDTIVDTPPKANLSLFAQAVEKQLDLPLELGSPLSHTASMVQLLGELAWVMQVDDYTENELAGDIRRIMESDNHTDLIPADWDKFEIRLARVLTIPSLVITMNATNALFGARSWYFEDAFETTSILPVFSGDDANHFMVTHELTIRYSNEREKKRIILALDNREIDQLIKILQGAQRKEFSLTKMTRDAGMCVLEDKV